ASTAGSVVGGYNSMTSAAMRYNMAASGGKMGWMGRAGMAMGVGTYSGMTSRGSQYVKTPNGRSTFVPVGSTPLGYQVGGSKLAKFNNMAGKGSIPAMLLGMGLQMGSDAAGPETGLGKGLGIAGDT